MKKCRKFKHEYADSFTQCPTCLHAANKKRYAENIEKSKVVAALWRANNAERHKANRDRWKKENFARDKANTAAWKAENIDKCKEGYKVWISKNHQSRHASKLKYENARKSVDALYKFTTQVRKNTAAALARRKYAKQSSAQNILGAPFNTVHTHLILSAIRNYGFWLEGEVYHLDHIVPLASAKTEAEVLTLCHYTNLQYLYPSDNLRKSDSLNWSLP